MTIGTGEGVSTGGTDQEKIDPKLVEKAIEINPTITPADKIDVGALRKSFENLKRSMNQPAKTEVPSTPQQPTPPSK